MKKNLQFLIMLTIICLSATTIKAQSPDWLWAEKAAGVADEQGNSIAVDSSGNSYVTGYFNSTTITFGSTTLTTAGGYDIFIAKYNANGNVVWAKRAGGSGDEGGYGIAVDGSGNSYVTGYFNSSSITFDTITLTGAGGNDMFIAKYDSSGNVMWAKSAGGSNNDIGNGIAVNSSGISYITGNFTSSSITFGSTTLTNASNDTSDIFIAKYDANG